MQHYTARESVTNRINGLIEKMTALQSEVAKLENELRIEKEKNNNRRKLNKVEVRQIKKLWENRANVPITQRELAEYFGVNNGTISRIVNGQYHAAV